MPHTVFTATQMPRRPRHTVPQMPLPVPRPIPLLGEVTIHSDDRASMTT